MAEKTGILTFKYTRKSTLPRREFAVDVTAWTVDGADVTVQYSVTAPDPLEASRLVRRDLTGKSSVATFRLEMVREIGLKYAAGDGFMRQVPTIVNVWDRNL